MHLYSKLHITYRTTRIASARNHNKFVICTRSTGTKTHGKRKLRSWEKAYSRFQLTSDLNLFIVFKIIAHVKDDHT